MRNKPEVRAVAALGKASMHNKRAWSSSYRRDEDGDSIILSEM